MYCVKCGKQIPDGSKFCTFCGSPQPVMGKPKFNENGAKAVHASDMNDLLGRLLRKDISVGSWKFSVIDLMAFGASLLCIIGMLLPVYRITLLGQSESFTIGEIVRESDGTFNSLRVIQVLAILDAVAACAALFLDDKLHIITAVCGVVMFILFIAFQNAFADLDFWYLGKKIVGVYFVGTGSIVLLISGIFHFIEWIKNR